jgi:tripartite ATP-independent transporter DctP family solute receptor
VETIMEARDRGWLTAAVLGAVVVGLVASGWAHRRRASAAIVLRLAHGLDLRHPVHQGFVRLDERLRELSGGTMRVEIFPNEQLGSERVNAEQLQLGCIDLAKTSAAPLEGFVPALGVFSLPFIFRDHDHFWRVLDGPVGEELLMAGNGVGLIGLCYYDSGSRSFYTRDKPVLSPDDLRGLKIRVMSSRTMMDMIRAMGGSPTPIDWGELYTALQQGVVDGAENNPPSVLTSRHYEVCPHYALDEHSRIPDILLISRYTWARLDDTQRAWLKQAAVESSRFQRELWREKTAEALEELKAAGMQVYRPDPAPFQAAVQEMLSAYAATPAGKYLRMIRETP